MLGIVDIERVVVERRQRTHRTDQHRHWVCIATEATEEKLHLLMHHGVIRHRGDKFRLLRWIGQLAVQQQVASFQEVAIHCELLDRVAAIKKFAFITINVSDR